MKKLMTFFLAGALISALSVGCNSSKESNKLPGLGEEIPGMEVKHATGTIIGSYSNGFGSLLVQVDEDFPIGEPIEYFDSFPCTSLPETGTYQNMIQVQANLPKVGKRISFSVREYQDEKDRDLFTLGSGFGNTLCGPPSVPMYVVTDLNPLND
ncbi:MAG: hypothetical protein LBR57_00020 [Alistipes sp.]|jgi:hypothetical protein|nr:hypothetical protein [Alistipes sp.]